MFVHAPGNGLNSDAQTDNIVRPAFSRLARKSKFYAFYETASHFFRERIIIVWNSLPPSIVHFESLSSFRNSLNNVNLRIHTMY